MRPYQAPWANKDPEHRPTPVWPGTVNGEELEQDSRREDVEIDANGNLDAEEALGRSP